MLIETYGHVYCYVLFQVYIFLPIFEKQQHFIILFIHLLVYKENTKMVYIWKKNILSFFSVIYWWIKETTTWYFTS